MSGGRHRPEEPGYGPGAPLDPRILRSVRDRALAGGGELDAIALAGAVHDSGAALGSSGALDSLQALQREVAGLSVLEPFAQRPGVTDVLVDGQGQVWTDSPRGLELTGFSFTSSEQVRSLAVHLAALAGRRLDAASPFMDMSVKNYRVHAVLPPIATAGPLISVRVKTGQQQDLGTVLSSAPAFWTPVLGALMDRQLNFLVTGGTGSGKTTLLQALLGQADPGQRLVIIEDTQELQVRHPHVVGLQTRAANSETAGEVPLPQLLIQALRMRPDRLVVGECRGAEIRDFLAAMNTGHQGACGTLHANDPQAVPARLAALGALAGWSVAATSLQAASALDVIIHLARGPHGERSPVSLALLQTDKSDRLRVRMLVDTGAARPPGQAELRRLRDKLGAEAEQAVRAWALSRTTAAAGEPC